MIFLTKLFPRKRPRSGELVWIPRGTTISEVDVGLTYAKVWHPKLASQGSAEVLEDGSLLFWSRRVQVEGEMHRLPRFLAWDRLGQAVFAWQMSSGRPPSGPLVGSHAPIPLNRMAMARGGLAVIRAFGGRYRSYLGFWIHRAGVQVLRRMARWPDPGFLDESGALVTGCTAILRFTYGGKARRMRLDQVRRHPNGNFHYMGRLLPSGEARTFSHKGISRLEIEGHGPIPDGELWVELHSLTTSAVRHHAIWASWCRVRRLTVPPEPDGWAWAEESLRLLVRHRLIPQLGPMLGRRLTRIWPRLGARIVQGVAAIGNWLAWARAELRPAPPSRRDLAGAAAPWRARVTRAAWRLERGYAVEARSLRHLRFLAQDPLFTRALLRGMLLYETRHLPEGDPALACLELALSHLPEGRRVLTWAEIDRAWNTYRDLSDDLLQLWHWPPEPFGPGDRPELLAALVLHALAWGPVCRHPAITAAWRPRFPPPVVAKTSLYAALLAFAARPDEGWQVGLSEAPRWRWLAGFIPGD